MKLLIFSFFYSDSDCADGLICGLNNCRDFHPKAEKYADCCTVKECKGEANDWNCCTSIKKCGLGGGDCDK